jgi:three-Cys-motif partner protein
MPSSDFFAGRKRWSERKHRLLGKYLPPFIAKVAYTTSAREIFIVDGFAGAARYDDGSKGSPVLIAEFSDVCRTWQNPATLRLINVEADKGNEGIFESLENETRSWVADGRVVNIRQDFATAVPDVLRIIGNAPSLFFIDPFGPTDLTFDSLRPILSRKSAVTELIINFDQDGLRRIVDAALSPNTDHKTAETNAKNISGIIGGDKWREQIEGATLTSLQAEQVLLTEYTQNLAEFGFYVVAYPIRESLESNPKYHFVYCTRHPDGLMLMNDFIREEEDELYGEHVEENIPLFAEESSLTNEIATRRARLKGILQKRIESKDLFTRGQLKDELVILYFGHFHGKDYNSVTQELINAGTITVPSGKKRINDDEPLRRT